MNRQRPAQLLAVTVSTLFFAVGCSRQEPQVVQGSAPATPPASAASVPTPPPPPPQPSADEQLASALDPLGATHGERGMTLRLSSAQFPSGKTSFEPEDASRIDRVVTALKEHPDTNVLIEGFTDNRGSESANQTLSRKRAESVRDALTARGVDQARLQVRGSGEEDPVGDNSTEEGRQMNRRVELIFSNAEGHFASADDKQPTG